MGEPSREIDLTIASIVDAVGRVRRILGVGLLERVYVEALWRELRKRGHRIEREVHLPVWYDGERLDADYRVDLLVDGIVVEAKACLDLHPTHFAQTLTYIRLTEGRVGLLVNFHAAPLRTGIHRLIRRADPSPAPCDTP